MYLDLGYMARRFEFRGCDSRFGQQDLELRLRFGCSRFCFSTSVV